MVRIMWVPRSGLTTNRQPFGLGSFIRLPLYGIIKRKTITIERNYVEFRIQPAH